MCFSYMGKKPLRAWDCLRVCRNSIFRG